MTSGLFLSSRLRACSEIRDLVHPWNPWIPLAVIHRSIEQRQLSRVSRELRYSGNNYSALEAKNMYNTQMELHPFLLPDAHISIIKTFVFKAIDSADSVNELIGYYETDKTGLIAIQWKQKGIKLEITAFKNEL